MKTLIKTTLSILLVLFFWTCTTKTELSNPKEQERKSIEMVTNYGTIVIDLYDETPKHRDNFIKLAMDGSYDSLLFHRVIEKFMIQGGDPSSKNAKPDERLGGGSLSYRVDAEFNPDLFHQRGALAAARDNNPNRASSSIQFYIVQGKVHNDSLLDNAETKINGWLAEYYTKNDPVNKPLLDSLQMAIDEGNMELYTLCITRMMNLAKVYDNFERYTIPESHRKVYKSIGGTPELDQNYTVFGQVVKGIEVVDSIAAVQTGSFDRPVSDVRIQMVRVLE